MFKFIKDNKNLIEKYGIKKYSIFEKYNAIKAFKLIEENPILKQYKEIYCKYLTLIQMEVIKERQRKGESRFHFNLKYFISRILCCTQNNFLCRCANY